jgi:hypothetical protein
MLLALQAAVSSNTLLWVLLAVLIVFLVVWLLGQTGGDPDIKRLIIIVLVVVVLWWGLGMLGLLGTPLARVLVVLLVVATLLGAFQTYWPVKDPAHPNGLEPGFKRGVHFVVVLLAILYVLYAFHIFGPGPVPLRSP